MNFFTSAFLGAAIILFATWLRKEDWLENCTIAAIFAATPILFAVSLGFLATFQLAVQRSTADVYLYRIDTALGLDPFALFDFTRAHPWYHAAINAVYQSLAVWMALAWAVERSRTMMIASLIGAVGVFPFYFLIPGVGPTHAFTWTVPHQLLPYSLVADLPRNAFPSMHVGWALLVAFNLRNGYLRAFAWLYVGLTVLATVGIGEHYFIDLAAAVPFCIGVQRLAQMSFVERLSATPAAIKLKDPLGDN